MRIDLKWLGHVLKREEAVRVVIEIYFVEKRRERLKYR